MTREELNMHSLTLIPDDTLTLVAKMVFVQVDLFELFFLLYILPFNFEKFPFPLQYLLPCCQDVIRPGKKEQ